MNNIEKISYFKCECGSDEFLRTYNVWQEAIKVQISEENGEEFWDVEELGKVKDHLCGFMCAKCSKDAHELNDGL